MNNLAVINHNGKYVIDSRQVAVMVKKRHDHLLRDINGYVEILSKSTDPKVEVSDFFIPSTYQDSTGRTLPCYLLTRKGCDLVANKMTGDKGVLFTAAYVTQFEEMEKALSATKQITPTWDKIAIAEIRFAREFANAAEIPASRAVAVALTQIEKETGMMLGEYRKIIEEERFVEKTHTAIKWIDGEPVVEKTYRATDIAREAGVTVPKIAKIAKANGLKTEEYGIILSRQPYNRKVMGIRYNEKGRARLLELVGKLK